MKKNENQRRKHKTVTLQCGGLYSSLPFTDDDSDIKKEICNIITTASNTLHKLTVLSQLFLGIYLRLILEDPHLPADDLIYI